MEKYEGRCLRPEGIKRVKEQLISPLESKLNPFSGPPVVVPGEVERLGHYCIQVATTAARLSILNNFFYVVSSLDLNS
uniref:Uncharacterized protein n=1 Tax=Vespula pensylvanica TaxID=30213 RepID=A0A834P1K6_VESPE|nr:hypothetical protein H0235_007586 [Vespula pensylvanica]